MTGPNASGGLVETVVSSLAALNPTRLASALEQLIKEEPSRWQQLLLFSDFLPEPSPKGGGKPSPGFAKRYSCVLEAMQLLIDGENESIDAVQDIVSMMQASSILQGYYVDIINELKHLQCTKDSPEIQIHRLIAMVEANARTIEEKATELHESAQVVDPLAAHATVFPTKVDGSKISLTQAYDSLCESVELGLRFILHSRSLSKSPQFAVLKGPYNDVDFEKFLALATIWRQVAESWGNMRFRGWQWRTQNASRGCYPKAPDAFLREHAAAIRYDRFLQDRILIRLLSDTNATEYLKNELAVAKSVEIPLPGQVWNGKVDIEGLNQLVEHSHFRQVVEEYVNNRHYMPLIERVRVGSLGWREWAIGKEVVVCIAGVLKRASMDQIAEDDVACMRHTILARQETLEDLITATGRLSASEAVDVVEALKFDPTRKSLEIWDQPIIPCGEKLVFLAPSIMTSGNPARALENFVSEWGGASFDMRGIPFEKYLVTEIRQRSTARAESGISVQLSNGSSLEFDVIAWWDGYLLLLEAKCEKAVFSPADYHRAKNQIDKSIRQLKIRRDALQELWPALRIAAPALQLPETYVGNDHVICISITNVMDFTGYSEDGVVVTDDSCFFRYFDERILKRYMSGDERGEFVGVIRNSELPNPKELMQYLLAPIQMRLITEKMSLEPHIIPKIGDKSPGFMTVHVEFNPNADKACWQPFFVSLKAYEIANLLCHTKQAIESGVSATPSEFETAIEELRLLGILGSDMQDPKRLEVTLGSPMCVRLPDGRYAIGDNLTGQFSAWIAEHVTYTDIAISPLLADQLKQVPAR